MNFSINLGTVSLKTITKEEIKTFRDFALLVNQAKDEIYSTTNLDLVFNYYDIMLYVMQNFIVDKNHYNYFTSNSKMEIGTKTSIANILKEYHDTVQCILKTKGCAFPVEIRLRPLISIFTFEANLNKPKLKANYVKEEVFLKLVDKFWFFVEFAKVSYSQKN